MQIMRTGFFVACLLLVTLASAFPTDGHGMQTAPQSFDTTGTEDALAGVPGVDGQDFPDNLRFGQPCEDMVEQVIEVVAPTPTPQLYPDSDDISWEIVAAIKSLSLQCGCNVSRMDSLPLAIEIWKSLPLYNHEINPCPKFLHDNPLFPETPTPTPTPIPLLPAETKAVEEIKDTDELYPAEKAKLIAEIRDKASSRITEHEEMAATAMASRTGEILMEPLPIVPEDCGEDVTGSVGLRNDEVIGAGKSMNAGYRPKPATYSPKGANEPLKVRERIIGARRAVRETLIALQTEAGTGSNECTTYQGMRYIASPPMSSHHCDVISECERNCLFDDDCTAWMFREPSNVRHHTDLNCELFNGTVAPKLVDADKSLTTALCPNTRVCSKTTMSHILELMSSDKAVSAGCPKVLERIVSGAQLQSDATCQCISTIREDAVSKGVADSDCVVSGDSVTWKTVIRMCDHSSFVLPSLLQHHNTSSTTTTNDETLPRKCQFTSTFSAGMGSCETYSPSASLSNHVHCRTDYDREKRVLAYQACWQCGECMATPSPTPYIPPPELMTSQKLPNGQTTPCLDARNSAINEMGTGPLAGWYVPDCFKDGSFMPTQCVENECWCVYESGVEISGSRFPRNEPERSTCRDAPPMQPVTPSFPEPKVDRQLVIARALAKLMYGTVHPETFCRPHKNNTLEANIFTALRQKHISNPTKPQCLPAHSTNSPNLLSTILDHATRCLVPPPVRKTSPSPSNTPSPSLSASISVSPSPSASAPIAMCGDVVCTTLGAGVRMYHIVPPGWCNICLEGTSGPCRDRLTFACHPYAVGSKCAHTQISCVVNGDAKSHVVKGAGPDCPLRSANETQFTAIVHLDTTHHIDFVNEWSLTLASAITDVVPEIKDLCDIELRDVTKQDDLMGGVSVKITVTHAQPDASLVTQFETSVADRTFLAALTRRGVPIDSTHHDGVTLVSVEDLTVDVRQSVL